MSSSIPVLSFSKPRLVAPRQGRRPGEVQRRAIMMRVMRSLLLLPVLTLAGIPAAAQSPSTLPTNPSAVFKTIVPHRDSVAAKPTIEMRPEENEFALPFLGFGGSPYVVGATLTPTSTVPEAEE